MSTTGGSSTHAPGLMFQTAGCYAAGKTMWDCRRVQPTICTALGCDAEFAAAVAACE